jgi:hypothetical protein
MDFMRAPLPSSPLGGVLGFGFNQEYDAAPGGSIELARIFRLFARTPESPTDAERGAPRASDLTFGRVAEA